MYQVSRVTSRMALITCHKLQQPQQQALRLLNLPSCTVGCFVKTPKNTESFSKAKQQKCKKCLKICKYTQYALWPEVSSPLGSGFLTMAHTKTHTHDRWTLQHRDWIIPVCQFSGHPTYGRQQISWWVFKTEQDDYLRPKKKIFPQCKLFALLFPSIWIDNASLIYTKKTLLQSSF